MWLTIDPLIAAGVVLATAATDAVYVMFTSAVVARKRMNAATWSSVWFPRRRSDRISGEPMSAMPPTATKFSEAAK